MTSSFRGETLAMDLNRPAASITFGKKKGWFVNRQTALMLSLLFAVVIVATGLLVYYYVPHARKSGQESMDRKDIKERASKLSAVSPVVTSNTTESPQEKVIVRLPRALKPLHYMVKLQPFVNGNFSIMGYVEVEMMVAEPTLNITLHIADIITKNETIKVVSYDDPKEPRIEILHHVFDKEKEFYIAMLNKELKPGKKYVLSMEFVGYLNDKLTGFYRSSYMDAQGNKKWIAATQFQPTSARKAFPCFDEPAMKATFEIFLARESSMSSLSNMPKSETTPIEGQNGWVWDHFNTSVPMSTYLVAFVISDFASMESNASDHVLFRVMARESAIQQADYSLLIGPETLSYFEEYFNVTYPLPKQDMVAIPDKDGPMENWGLIIHRESTMLYDPAVSSTMDKKSVALTVAHELSHQWFGNLVTPDWWSDLWLNEGFATFMQYIGVDHVEPTWKIMEQFIPDVLQSVFTVDWLETSHRLSFPVEHPDEIKEIFDIITYSKGASVIRMMTYFLTEKTFRKGVTNYLTSLKYKNAEQDDLWQYLTVAAHEDDTLPKDMTMKKVMDTWTLQMGYPVIKVVRSSDGTSANITQERFLMVWDQNYSDTHFYKWWVPLTYTSQDNPNFNNTQTQVWLKDYEAKITVSSLPRKDQWVIFNVQETGFYKVNYDDDNWNLLIKQLNSDHKVIHVINRAQIIDDAMDLAQAGQLSYKTALDVIAYLGNEEEYIPWESALSNLVYLKKMFIRSKHYGALKNYLLNLLTPLYESVGFQDNINDPHLEQLKRVKALTWACNLEYQDCVNNSVSLYQKWMENPSNRSIVSPNLKSIVYCTAIAAGDEEEWNFGWNQYLNSNVGSDKEVILSSLGCSKKIWILSRYLDMAFSNNSGMREQDAPIAFVAVARNSVGHYLTWNYVRDNWQKITDFFGSGIFVLSNIIEKATETLNTHLEMKELKLFKERHAGEFGPAKRTVDQSIEGTTINIAWMTNNSKIIVQWLSDHGYSTQLNNQSTLLPGSI
ncbi:aminopeptidase N isoform X2 [Cherax quadricarinatus]|uniref:aminopeptidase N isoform X2 n=1 Tax=Cherax quadricarinatus TaxID=27406 RepID=UPI00387E5CA0